MPLGLKCCESDHSLYVLLVNGNTLIFVVYVDDLFIIENNIDFILGLKRQLDTTFEIASLGILHYFLSLQVFPLSDGIFISYSNYCLVILKHFNVDDCKLYDTHFQSSVKLINECSSPKVNATLYGQLVDSLIYLTHSHPNISFFGCVVTWFM